MIHHPILLGSKIILLLILIIVLIILHGILPPEQFKVAVVIGITVFILSVFALWTVFFLMLKNPNSKLSKSLVLTVGSIEGTEERIREKEKMASMIGREGIAETNLRPAGIGRFDGELMDVVSDRLFITKGQRIDIVGVDGKKLKVKKLET